MGKRMTVRRAEVILDAMLAANLFMSDDDERALKRLSGRSKSEWDKVRRAALKDRLAIRLKNAEALGVAVEALKSMRSDRSGKQGGTR